MATSQTTPSLLQEEERISQEVRELLSSLPREDSWRYTPLYQYQGIWYTKIGLPGTIACQRHFQARDSDILLATTPKSGTTWLKALAFAIVNRTRYRYPQHPLLTNNPHKLVPFLEVDLYPDNQIHGPDNIPSPAVICTHIPYMALPQSIKDSNCKVVYLCRNPKDVFISLWHFITKWTAETQSYFSLEEAFDLFCAGVTPFGPFWDHVLGYWKASLEKPEKVMFLKYEDLKREPMVQLKRLAEFLGYPFTSDEERKEVIHDILRLCSFENLSNLEVNKTGKFQHRHEYLSGLDYKLFFRRGEVGDSSNYLTSQMIERLDGIIEEKLQGYDLKFEVSI
ncbi:cytosolic sulfotransferase 12-like [Magnolia sinica]|uniref:cytosolic sulfotransferase 12-like n=1 Tax=Magnolia sinica TaxID=86752 RepID=UPI00265A2E9B|nr:cytosolic sulfotransferase 12-like [Magnolia sinica]